MKEKAKKNLLVQIQQAEAKKLQLELLVTQQNEKWSNLQKNIFQNNEKIKKLEFFLTESRKALEDSSESEESKEA